MVTDVVLRTRGLVKRFGGLTAVDRLDIEVRRGEVVGLLGPNGAGKSTTIGMILGLVRPSAGTAEVAGRNVWQGGAHALAAAGAIVETPAFYPYLSGRDNLVALALIRGGAAPARIDGLLARVGLTARARSKYRTYSLGMKQRLGIASTVRVNDDPAGTANHTLPRIAVAADGSAVAVWVDRRSGQYNIYSARLAAGATTWGPNIPLTDDLSSTKDSPDVTLTADGTAHAVWNDDRIRDSVYYASLAPGSSTWSVNTRISDEPLGYSATQPRIGADGAGTLLVIWFDNRTGARVRSSRRPAGGAWTPSQAVASASTPCSGDRQP